MEKRNITYLWLLMTLSIVSVGITPAFAEDPRLPIESFLGQVREKHLGVRGAREISQGALLRSKEGTLLLAPIAFGSAQQSSDKRETLSPSFQGSETKISTYSLGVSQLTTFGLQGKLSYNLVSTTVGGASPALVTQSSFYDARPVLELTQSLWRNGFGREIRATQELLEAQALATSYAEDFRITAALAEAESAYWRLALARETVQAQKESLERFTRMRDLNAQRARMQLSDRADLLQAEAALQAKKLELQTATDEEKAAARGFNTLRGLDSDTVSERLVALDDVQLERLSAPNRAEMRGDVKASQQQMRAATANVAIGLEKTSPTLEAFATVSTNGRDPALGSSTGESFTGQHPWTIVGIRFSTALDFGTVSDARSGYEKERIGAEYSFERKRFEQDREWNDLTLKFSEAKERLKLARSVEAAQKEKLNYEKDRHRRGRTTTFQVLLFEQDYANAQLNHFRSQFDVLRLVAQLRTFGGNQ